MSNPADAVTVIIHSRNEEKHIKDCIDSAKLLTNKIVVVDMESADDTVKIAKSCNATIYSFPFSSYVEPAREFGIKTASTEWVFILDADERMTKQLAQEIRQTILRSPFSFYKVPRKNMFAGKKWLRHGGWWPDYQIRLLKPSALEKWPKQIHSVPQFAGEGSLLKEPLLHLFHGDFEEMVKKTVIFEDIESDLLFRANRKVSLFTFFRKFLGELNRRLIKGKGFLDGPIGIIESIYQAYSKTITYLYLYEKKKSRNL